MAKDKKQQTEKEPQGQKMSRDEYDLLLFREITEVENEMEALDQMFRQVAKKHKADRKARLSKIRKLKEAIAADIIQEDWIDNAEAGIKPFDFMDEEDDEKEGED